MNKLRMLIASIAYFAIVGILMVFGFKFSGFLGWIELIILGFACHSFVDVGLKRLFGHKKENNKHV